MNIKKRSESSRAKTLQSEDTHKESSWAGNMHAKKILSKVGQKITSSMI